MMRVYTKEEIRKLREFLRMTRDEFAGHLGVTAEAVKGWEQGRRNPSGSANLLIKQLGEKADEKRKVVENNAKIGRAVLKGNHEENF